MNINIGDLINQTGFTHYTPSLQVRFAAPKGRVAVMLLLGDADKKAPETFDATAALNNLGWIAETELEDAQSQLAALREELETAKDDLVIFKGGLSALGEASKKLVFSARTTGGTAGPDQGLMDACAGVEGVITLAGIARAMDEAEQLTAERDDLKVRLENARDRKNSIVDLQQRLADAERRNAVLVAVVEENHEWHTLYGEDFGYKDSPLYVTNTTALNPNPEAASHDE